MTSAATIGATMADAVPVKLAPGGGGPELLSPAGDWACARAAVENGADAIYFGLERFNARMRADNFTLEDLPRLMAWLHERGVKGYLTFNILVFPDEWTQAERELRAIIAAGADAAIVQDVGICRLIRSISPDFPIHASTQMTISSAAGVEFARELGCSMVALARECSIAEIARIHAAAAGPVPDRAPALEVFVHGALCVAYSGQCLTSESLGGRSANRGVCAQACRLPYELVRDGQPVDLGDRRYLLSPQDLAGLELLPDLIRAGVRTLKIEGRLKSAEYVANITQVYRRAIDRLMASSAPEWTVSSSDRYAIEMAFSRGLHTGWLRGINHRELVHGRFGKKRGVYLGQVTRVRGDRVAVRLLSPLKPGDGVVFDGGRPDQPEEGGRVYEVTMRGQQAWLGFGRGDLDLRRIKAGDRLWKTSDPELERRLQRTFQPEAPQFTRPLDIEVEGSAGEPLLLRAKDGTGLVVETRSTVPLAQADQHPLDEQRLTAHLGRLGGTPFRLRRLTHRLEGPVILPLSELNRLRRETVTRLLEQRRAGPRWTLRTDPADLVANNPPLPAFGHPLPHGPRARGQEEEASCVSGIPMAESGSSANSNPAAHEPEIIPLVRTMPQLEAAIESGAGTVYCEFDDPRQFPQAVHQVRAAANAPRPRLEVWLVPPRITKPGEEAMLGPIRDAGADGLLVRNYDHLAGFAGMRRRGDFSLNVANPSSAEHFIRRYGLERVTAAYDLNGSQLEDLLRGAPPAWFEITIHQHMPMFHMDHCVFCAFLSAGADHRTCGRPCEKHQVRLRDRVGIEHPVRADAGCRNTVFNGVAQTGAEWACRLAALGARVFRVEFVDEPPDVVSRTLAQYRRLLRGEIAGDQLARALGLMSYVGISRGPEQPAAAW